MEKILTYEQYINTPINELDNIDIDNYTDEEIYNLICFQKQYDDELNHSNVLLEEKKRIFNIK